MDMYSILRFTGFILFVSGTQGVCLFEEKSSGCVFQCHCQDSAPCNNTTGSCPAGCDEGVLRVPWRGAACQIGNIALQKTAKQSSVFYGWVAQNAIDGRVSYVDWMTEMSVCVHTNWPDPGWWEVDLGRLYKIHNITIHNRKTSQNRLSQFWIAVRNSSTDTYPVTNTELCYQNRTYGNPGDVVHIQCYRPIVGRYIRLSKYQDIRYNNSLFLLNFCEFIAIGHLYIDCSRCPGDKQCSDVTGCTECYGAYQPDCVKECNDGNYGTNCEETCGKCNVTTCNKINGSCSGGCQLWYAGLQCKDQIVLHGWNNETAEVTGRTSSSLEVSWQPLSAVRADLAQFYGYTVYHRIGNSTENVTKGQDVHHKTGPHSKIEGLLYNTYYEIIITPYRKMDGQTEHNKPYRTLNVKTTCGVPDRPSIQSDDGTIISGSQASLFFKFKLLDLNARCDNITHAFIEYKVTSDNDYSRADVPVNTTSYVIESLKEGSYSVRLTVVNNENISATSEIVMITIGHPQSGDIQGPTNPPGLLLTVIPSVVVPVLIICAVVVTVIFVMRRKKRNGHEQSARKTRKSQNGQGNQAFDLNLGEGTSVASGDTGDSSSRDKSYSDFLKATSDPLPETSHHKLYNDDVENLYVNCAVAVSSFEGYVKKKMANMKKFEEEYRRLPQSDKTRCKVAQLPGNKDKNRFKNIFPYDDTRVLLKKAADEISDYINANYITGYRISREYIATQGPLVNTAEDFWKMVWQENVNRIVMVANLEETGKIRCSKYWPGKTGTELDMGLCCIVMEAEEVCADYTTRILTLHHKNDVRTVRQFHFTSWEDKNKPLFGATSLQTFFRKVHSFDNRSNDPMLVHCSAGVGRTGTFIALDILLQQARHEKCMDVFSWVQKLRLERMFMVQTKEQYFFLHDALVEFTKCANTGYSCNGLQQTFMSLCNTTRGKQSKLEKQFQLLNEFRPPLDNANKDGLLNINQYKNRDDKIIPDDSKRPYLQGHEKETYINAVYADSFKAHDSYIVTQIPLPNTVSDFWRLVYEHNCHTIIMLNAIDKADQISQAYWPNEKGSTEAYGQAQVRVVRPDVDKTSKAVKVTDLEVTLASKYSNKASTQKVRHFQLLTWPPENELPPATGDLLNLLDMVQHWQQYNIDRNVRGKTIVHCLDGGSASGLYCAISHTLDRMKVEQEVDAFLAARYIMRSRPQFISTIEQYKFMYRAALEYMSRYSEYANFQ